MHSEVMSKKPKATTEATITRKRLRYTLVTVIEVDANEPSEIADINDTIERNNEYGKCSVSNVEVIDGE